MLTGRQLLGAIAALAAALAVFYPPGGVPHRLGEDLGSDASGGCPLGFGRVVRDADGPRSRSDRSDDVSPAAAVRVFVDATIWTGDATVPWAEAMAVTDAGRVLAVGQLSSVSRAAGEGAPRISLGGGWVVPGLHDAHLHLVFGGFRLAQLDLSRVASRDAFERLVADRVAHLDDDDAWVLGGGWDHTLWGGEEPTAEWFPGDVKAWLLRADAHTGVASQAALRAAGIDANTPDPPGGIIVRDDDGNPTGALRDNAIALIAAAIPPASEEARHAAFRRAFDHLLSLGVTSACDFGDVDHLAGSSVEGASGRLWRDLDHLDALDAAGKLPIRVSAYLPLADWKRVRDHPARNGNWFRERNTTRMSATGGDDRIDSYGDASRVRVAGAKAFLDGSLGAGTALMSEPYADDPENRGVATCDHETFTARVVAADAAGVRVAAHAIGDAAVDAAIAAAEEARRANGPRDARFRVEHAQHLSSPIHAQPRRMAAVGATASVQPTHMTLDRRLVLDKLGAARASRSYAFGTMLENRVTVAGGSDWPVVDADPIAAMEAAVTRGGDDGDAWEPTERVDAETALGMYTAGAARVAGLEGLVGILWRGSFADFAVLDASPMDIGAEGRKRPKVTSTWVGGQCAYGCEDALDDDEEEHPRATR
jgi:predicted amidohydrolase YtcJ